jgi:hypothetical protein
MKNDNKKLKDIDKNEAIVNGAVGGMEHGWIAILILTPIWWFLRRIEKAKNNSSPKL